MKEASLKILIVDDNATDLMLIKEAIAGTGRDVILQTAANGEEAMKLLRQVGKYVDAPRPDLILLDLNMPRKNGLEVLDEIKRDRLLMRIPIVILTTSGSRDDISKAYASHANCYIRKPVDYDRFDEVIELLIRFWLDTVSLPEP